MLTSEGKGLGRILKKKCRRQKCPPKMNPCSKFHPNRTMAKCSKSGEKFRGKGGGENFEEKNVNVTKAITK